MTAWTTLSSERPVPTSEAASYVLFGQASLPDLIEHDLSGSSVAGAGDVNGDCIYDIITRVPEDLDGFESGSSHMIFGQASSPDVVTLSSLDGTDGFTITGAFAGDLSGFSVAGAGDVSGDGVDDIIMGAPQAKPSGLERGSSYAIFGVSPPSPPSPPPPSPPPSPPPTETFYPTFELSALDGANGFIIKGIDSGDHSCRLAPLSPALAT
jgi:glycosylphosphatidylinositol phospholipase D